MFSFWTALGWTVLTCGIFGYYVVYQLVRRMREHNRRRLDLLEAGIAFAWEQAQRRPAVADELRPTFESMAGNLGVLRQMTTEFRDPAIWTLLAFLSSGIATVVAFVLLDGDLVRHTAAERAVQADLGRVYLRLGQELGPVDGTGEGPPQLRRADRGRPSAASGSTSCGGTATSWSSPTATSPRTGRGRTGWGPPSTTSPTPPDLARRWC